MNRKQQFLGLGKTKFNSSICLYTEGDKVHKAQLLLTERFNRVKASGAWPEIVLLKKLPHIDFNNLCIAENRDVHNPRFIEDIYDSRFPFYDYLKKKNLDSFTTHFNSKIQFISHHEAHAYAALAMSPFEKSLIVVLDGAGSSAEDIGFSSDGVEKHEECSVYLQDKGLLKLVEKRWIQFAKSKNHPEHTFSNGIGSFYEKCSEYIFNSSTSSGKVMGLAPLGSAYPIKDIFDFQEKLDWSKSFKEKSKKAWQESPYFSEYCNLAASVQRKFEESYWKLLTDLRKKHPEYSQLILTGGCALNCTNNAKIYYSKLFDRMYVPPFPGDESISIGSAFASYLKKHPEKWEPVSFDEQSPYLGTTDSIPDDQSVEKFLTEKKIPYQYCSDVAATAAQDLAEMKIIAWFQGRSEAGPRALGNRSILANPLRVDLKNYLNDFVKLRENFRPYGCTVLHEKAHEYFDVEKFFDNPFMSYAIKVKPEYQKALEQVTHIDGTSRMQTLRKNPNPLFHDLINHFGKKTNLYCVLNTSLNVMDEPIVETIEDALRFFEKTPVDSLFIGNFRIHRT